MSVETPEYLAMMRRMIRAAGRRVGDADEVDLRQLVDLRSELDEAIAAAARELADRHSWTYVAQGLGMTRQSAWERFSTVKRSREASARQVG